MKVNFNRIVIPTNKEWTRNILTNLLRCKICLNILNNPYDCLCCNQTFCKSCIYNYIKTNNKCPYGDYFNNDTDKPENNINDTLRQSCANIRNIINSLKFYCNNREHGCNTELSIEGLDEHEKTCAYKKAKTIINNKRNQEKVKAFNGLEGLEELNEKEKFKFQDSCMSFRNVDSTNYDSALHTIQTNNNNNVIYKTNGNPLINTNTQNIYQHDQNTIHNGDSDNNNNDVNINNNYTNFLIENLTNKINELSTFMYSVHKEGNSMLDSVYRNRMFNNKKGNSISNTNNNMLNKIQKKKVEVHISPRKKDIKIDDVESTPKFKRLPHKGMFNTITTDFVLSSSATCKNFRTTLSNNNNNSGVNNDIGSDSKLFTEIKKLNSKVTYIERLVQSNSALESQKYFVQTKRNSCDVNDTSKSFSTQISSFDLKLNSSKKSLQTLNKSSINSSKNIRKKITENMNKQTDNNNSNRSIFENLFPTKEYINNLFINKLEEMKQYIEDNCVNELKTHFLDITMDSVNLFIEKLNEFTQTIGGDSQSQTLS